MIRTKNILTVMAAAMTLAACNEMDDVLDRELQPIRLTTNIAQTTRAITPTQETVIATGQNIYVWANEEATPGTADWTQNPYLNAWRLTKGDGSPNEWSSQSSTPYYPTRPMSMVAVHGNLQPSIVEERTQVPASVVHTVKTDQRHLTDYAASDLLYWNATGINAVSNNPIQITFGHKLAKIEVELKNTDGLYTEEDLRDAVVTLNSLMTSATLTVTDATPGNMGQLSAATGTATTIRPYAANGLQREAIVPPQAKPANLISISLHGYTYTLDPAQPTTDFATNTRYHYILTVNKHAITQETQITPWGDYTAGGSDPVTITSEFGMHPKNIKMNPLWYVAETNVDYTAANGSKTWDSGAGKFTFASSITGYYYFTWNDALKYFSNTANYSAGTPTSINGSYESSKIALRGWHLPSSYEWNSIYPGRQSNDEATTIQNLVNADGEGKVFDKTVYLCFGYDDETKGISSTYMTEKSYWYQQTGSIFYAIRYCDSKFCSAWKYEWANNILTISCTLLDDILSTSEAATLYGTDASKWATITFGNNESIGAVQRQFYTTGQKTSSGTGITEQAYYGEGGRGSYWATTERPSNTTYGLYWHYYHTNTLTQASAAKTSSFTIRLFRDNSDYDVLKNPLWYVAEYNMTNAQNAATLTMGSADNQGYYYTWADAMSTFATTTTSYNGYKKGNKVISGKTGTWHLPTKAEYWSIIPWGSNMWGDSSYDEDNNFFRDVDYYIAYWGYDYNTKTVGVIDHSFWHKVSSTEVHALRFLGTPYCSAWKYVWTGNTLIIYATMIEPIFDSEYNAKVWYDKHWPSVYFGNDASKGAVKRNFYARGSITNASGSTATTGANSNGRYWSTTEYNNTTGNRFSFASGITYVDTSNGDKAHGFCVRMFLDN